MAVSVDIKKLTSFTLGSAVRLKETVWRPLLRILTFSPADDTVSAKKNLAVSISRGSFSVAYGSRFLSLIKIKQVREYSFEEGKYPQPEGFASSLALAINDLGTAKTDLSLSVPKAWAVMKTAQFPVTVKENLSSVISYELDRLTPFNPEDAFYDFKILAESAGKLTVLVIAAKADLIKPYIEALRGKGLTVGRVTVNLSGIGTLCRYAEKEDDFIFTEIDKNEYEGALFLDGSIAGAFAGSFSTPPVPQSAKSDRESEVDTLATEIGQLIATLKNQGKSPRVIALLRDNKQVGELLKSRINAPLKLLTAADIKLIPPGQQTGIPYAAIGGVLESLWPRADALDLLRKGLRESPKYPLTLTIALLIAIIVIWIFYMVSPVKIEEKRLTEIDRQIMLRKEEIKKIEALKKDIGALESETSTISNFRENRPTALNILMDLTTILPKTTWLTRVRITETTVDIEGYASSASTLLPKLESSKYFNKSEFASPTFRDTRMNADRFNIKMEIAGVKKTEGENKKIEKK
jgi:Tfp pilus assembly protein PilN